MPIDEPNVVGLLFTAWLVSGMILSIPVIRYGKRRRIYDAYRTILSRAWYSGPFILLGLLDFKAEADERDKPLSEHTHAD